MAARENLTNQHKIRRIGLTTRHGMFVEAFYADRRTKYNAALKSISSDNKGNLLVSLESGINLVCPHLSGHYLHPPFFYVQIICCEGNAGFVEIGTPVLPLEQGYSVLAWNHAGFGASEGLPFPEEERASIEVAVLFAIYKLRFNPADIRLFAWSIGGYAATWAAMNFPDIGGLVKAKLNSE
ncbi:unnamed protein product [Protopolystoma xenopodis]|uniref:AB hydrolase-1 domain-containing protein n=1 Tax=Protopolystoma xenopodis TaxID=117903 RepID=A0A448X478_9PLAT|nr:unnamed protein product [Protopolystoma xenopodis]